MDVQVRGQNIRCFWGKSCIKIVKLKDCEIKQGGSKTFQKRYYRNRECLNIANLVNTKVAEITKHQPHVGKITYYLSKELK